jgi:hypothetical protein
VVSGVLSGLIAYLLRRGVEGRIRSVARAFM